MVKSKKLYANLYTFEIYMPAYTHNIAAYLQYGRFKLEFHYHLLKHQSYKWKDVDKITLNTMYRTKKS